MGVPFEALLPYAIITGMFGVTGAGLYVVKRFANDGKKPRWNRDLWDRVSVPTPFVDCGREIERDRIRWLTFLQQMMERDLRITGSLRGQSSNHQAPPGFDVSKPWKVEKRIF
ncbi:hypothetical protein POX_d06076 [Penicillium oxalicum]|uniref:hypothetical protein n=1 Tax=Penicillium oxalicum TaxID=69781 RepID=UPI0020B7CEC3|nr:hypothetical protein POX_d06076 [Penicillium oxalicum]KAI2790556.1 hypothetical protein POX_d06076 [Penicillium oxalicum]